MANNTATTATQFLLIQAVAHRQAFCVAAMTALSFLIMGSKTSAVRWLQAVKQAVYCITKKIGSIKTVDLKNELQSRFSINLTALSFVVFCAKSKFSGNL